MEDDAIPQEETHAKAHTSEPGLASPRSNTAHDQGSSLDMKGVAEDVCVIDRRIFGEIEPLKLPKMPFASRLARERASRRGSPILAPNADRNPTIRHLQWALEEAVDYRRLEARLHTETTEDDAQALLAGGVCQPVALLAAPDLEGKSGHGEGQRVRSTWLSL